MKKIVVGICGLAGSGKDTTAQYLVDEMRFVRVGFADRLKEVARDAFGWNGLKDERGRRLLQVLGTEVGRAYDPQLWIRHWEARVHSLGALRVVVPDVRFENEARAIFAYGGLLLHVEGRGGLKGPEGGHVSEDLSWLPSLPRTSVDNSGDFAHLRQNVTRIVGGAWLTAVEALPKLYISGPMSGLLKHNFPAFHEAADLLREAGHEVVNPASIEPEKADTSSHEYFLRRDIRLLLDCDGIALLPGWETSSGATLEVRVAGGCGMTIRPLREWLGD